MSGKKISPARRVLTVAAAALVLIVLPTIYLLTRDWDHALNEDIRASIPELAESPQAREIRQELQGQATNSVLLKVTAPGAETDEVRVAIREAAAAQPVFGAVFFPGDTEAMKELGRFIYEHRETLFAPGWLQEHWQRFQATGQPSAEFSPWLAQQTVTELDAFLNRAEATAYTELIPEDPWLLIPQAREALPETAMSDSGTVLAWLPAKADALSHAGQVEIARSLTALEDNLRQRWPDVRIESGGVFEIAERTEVRTRRVVMMMNVYMGLAIFLLLALLLRRLTNLLLVLIPLAAAVLVSTAAGLLVFGEIHALALGIASVVLGLAVDYTVHLVANGHGGGPLAAWRCIRKPLLAGCLSSCLGLLFLWLAPLPAIRQVGLMVPAGLLGALAAVRWIMPYLLPGGDEAPLRKPLYLNRTHPVARAWLWLPLVVGLGAALVLAVNLSFDDEIDSYQIPVGDAMERYQKLLKEFGQSREDIQSRWFTFADSPVALLENLNRVRMHGVALAGPASLLGRSEGSEAWEVFEPQREAYGEALLEELEAQGFEADAFEDFTDGLEELPERVTDPAATEAIRELAGRLRGPMRGALMTDGTSWIGTFGVKDRVRVPATLEETAHVLDERVELNHALAASRRVVLRNALWGVLAVGAVLCVVFGWRQGLAVALLPVWAVTLGLAVALMLTDGLSLLAVIGAVLAYCLGLDYGAFAVHFRRQAPVSVRVSALTTASAFVVLAFSPIKAVGDLGIVVAVSVLFAWLGAELLGLPRRGSSAQDA